ncbi:DUF6691 family protein [Brachymonas chironomi]|uniref:DUF6691 family protein n=1 Tax=Brachymonas chironomi TaxID=491919 RepID=UPI00036A82DE|nr:DUF6691 family protein [Brachymonas chironomi]
MAKTLSTLLAGLLFGFGLALSTMMMPEIVLEFLMLDDLGLMLVMGGGIAVATLGLVLGPKLLKKPVFAETFDRYTSGVTRNMLVGSALFGIGWGLSGVCPGPMLAGLGVGNWDVLWGITGMALGALAHGLTQSPKQ